MKKTVITTALLVGTLDITYAIAFSYFRSGTAPQRPGRSSANRRPPRSTDS